MFKRLLLQLNYSVVNKVVQWKNCGKTVPIFHTQTEVGDRLTTELSGQRTEGKPTLLLHASEIEDNNLRQCAC